MILKSLRMRVTILIALASVLAELFFVILKLNVTSTIIAGVVSIILISISAWIIMGKMLSPIEQLAKQAKSVYTTESFMLLEAPSTDVEVVELVDTLNSLLKQISQASNSKTKFCNAASHELRTPIQALLGHLDVALSRKRSDVEYEEVIKEAHTQAKRIINLVRDLLLLNELEMHTSQPPLEPADVSEICEMVMSQLDTAISNRKLMVCPNLPPGTEIMAAPSHIEILLRNIIENAAKYADYGGGIYVELHQKNSGGELRVFNDFTQDIKLDAEYLFEPFSRADASRNSKTGGNGLGLAICKAITDYYGWQISLIQNEIGVSVNIVF